MGKGGRVVALLACAVGLGSCSTAAKQPVLRADTDATSVPAVAPATQAPTSTAPAIGAPTITTTPPTTRAAAAVSSAVSQVPSSAVAVVGGVDAIRADALEYHRAYYGAYLAMPNIDIAAMAAFAAPGSDSFMAIEGDLNALLKKGIRVRRNNPDINVTKIGKIELLDATTARVSTCDANNLVSYTEGPTASPGDDVVIDASTVTVIATNDYEYSNGRWREATQRNIEKYQGNKCDSFE